MTLEEVSLLLGKSPNTISKHYTRTKETLAKKGIILTREGNGKNAVYDVRFIKE